MKTVGIIGYGSFGKFLAENLDKYFKISVYSRSVKAPKKWAAAVAEVARCDYLILSIPLVAYRQVLKQLKPNLGKNTVIIDVCSVKQKPLQIIKTMMPGQPFVATHPLFGPQSAAESLQGHTLVICPEESNTVLAQKIKRFAENKLGLKVVEISAEQHDKEMAKVHGLTFFIAHALKDFNIQPGILDTPSYKQLLKMVELEKHHSEDLFTTIQSGNEYTKTLRKKFIKHTVDLDTSINTNTITKDN